MNTASNNIAVEVSTNRVVEVVEVKGGWTTIRYTMLDVLDLTHLRDAPHGGEFKVRNSALRDLTSDESARVSALLEMANRPHRDRMVPADLTRYTQHQERTLTGRHVIDVNDEIAGMLRGHVGIEMYQVAAKFLGVTVGELRDKYDHLNPGMRRMTLGVLMRGAARRAVGPK